MNIKLTPTIEMHVVEEARKWLGTPYRHQGSRKQVGADCLGLIRGIWREIYGNEPQTPEPYAMDWAEKGDDDRLLNAAVKHFNAVGGSPSFGHLVLFRWHAGALAKHAGIMVSDTSFIHAYSGVGVVESPLVPAWRKKTAGVFAFRQAPKI
jgi:NlpC/P60 family putative phage cell wall peptidase